MESDRVINEVVKIKINLDDLSEISFTGIRRAYVFMGFGINSSSNESFIQYNLAGLTGIEIVEQTEDIEIINQYKEEFRDWIVQCGLREMIESFKYAYSLTMSLKQLEKRK